MARDLNRHECIGRLGADPEIKYQPSGEAVTNINVACSNTWKDKASGQKQERTEWIRYVAFGKLAEIIGEYCKKGSKLYLTGELRTRKWTDQSGQDRYVTEIVATEMQMLDGRQNGGGQQQEDYRGNTGSNQPSPTRTPVRQQPAQDNAYAAARDGRAPQQPAEGFDSFDDDIPF